MPQAECVQEVEQLRLFDFGVDMNRLKRQRDHLASFSRSPNTEKAYRNSFSSFQRWCVSVNRRPLPASAETVALYLTARIEGGLRVATATVHAAAISAAHRTAGKPDPAVDPSVRLVLSGARRKLKQTPQGKKAVTPGQLLQLSLALKEEGSSRSVRDRALLVLGFGGGFRRSELSALKMSNVEFVDGKGLLVTIAHSKTDQTARGRVLGIHAGQKRDTCPVRLLEDWLRLRGKYAGPLFPRVDKHGNVRSEAISGQMINVAVKRALRLIHIDPRAYGAHSLRAGCVTAAVDAGANVFAVMERTGHKSVETVARYVRRSSVFEVDALAGAL
jgi:integrase